MKIRRVKVIIAKGWYCTVYSVSFLLLFLFCNLGKASAETTIIVSAEEKDSIDNKKEITVSDSARISGLKSVDEIHISENKTNVSTNKIDIDSVKLEDLRLSNVVEVACAYGPPVLGFRGKVMRITAPVKRLFHRLFRAIK